MSDSRVFVTADAIRSRFSAAMSEMYRREVPQYGALLALVETVNRETLEADPELAQALADGGELQRLDVERHGAIRVGTAAELAMLRRLFAVMGMVPVGYYDLSQAGVPVHSTAFRPVDEESLRRNPFRIFTSLLRLELIDDSALQAHAAATLAERDIFTPGTREMITTWEHQGGLDEPQADRFVREALETFRWHQEATVDLASYQALHRAHRLIADVVCFRGPHINHLTPRTLDIDEVQRRMPVHGIEPKAIIEGPPPRRCPLLLRQTSFKALEEPIRFADSIAGHHSARFGEIEQRGIALTAKGRDHYDRLLEVSRQQLPGPDNQAHQRHLAHIFEEFPDDYAALWREGLAFFRFQACPQALPARTKAALPDTPALVASGALRLLPMVYEDFLPVSAAGIFQSNLGGATANAYRSQSNRASFEQALGCEVRDEFELYRQHQAASLEKALAELKLAAGC